MYPSLTIHLIILNKLPEVGSLSLKELMFFMALDTYELMFLRELSSVQTHFKREKEAFSHALCCTESYFSFTNFKETVDSNFNLYIFDNY